MKKSDVMRIVLIIVSLLVLMSAALSITHAIPVIPGLIVTIVLLIIELILQAFDAWRNKRIYSASLNILFMVIITVITLYMLFHK